MKSHRILNHAVAACIVTLFAVPTAQAGREESAAEQLREHTGALDDIVSTSRDLVGDKVDSLPDIQRERMAAAEAAAMRGDAPRSERRALKADAAREGKKAVRQAERDAKGLNGTLGRSDRASKYLGHASDAATAAHRVEMLGDGRYEEVALDYLQDKTDDIVQSGVETVGKAICGRACGDVGAAGFTAGTYIREIDLCAMGMADCGPGSKRTVWDVTTDAQYMLYEKVRFALDPESDPSSAEFERKWRAKAEANRRAYQQHSAALEAAQAQVDASRAAAAQAQATAQTAYAGSEPGLFDTLGDVMNTALQMQVMQNALAPQRNSSSPAAADPSGCHPGHDEQAHPGGCHDYSGGTATNR